MLSRSSYSLLASGLQLTRPEAATKLTCEHANNNKTPVRKINAHFLGCHICTYFKNRYILECTHEYISQLPAAKARHSTLAGSPAHFMLKRYLKLEHQLYHTCSSADQEPEEVSYALHCGLFICSEIPRPAFGPLYT